MLDAQELASRLFLNGRSHAPIFNDAALHAMTDAGLLCLESTQRADGSRGRWPGSTVGDPYLTAYALEGLIRARQADVIVKQEMSAQAYAYLGNRLDATEDLHLLAYFAYVLSLEGHKDLGAFRKLGTLYARRDRMNAYGQALLALALKNVHEEETAQVVVRNLFTLAKRNAEWGTAHWEGDADRYYWRWYNDKQEMTAMVLRALVEIPLGRAPEEAPNTQGAAALEAGTVRWLVDNRFLVGDELLSSGAQHLHIKSDNDYDYVIFEDMKPAGLEAMETRSGEAYGDGLCSNFELRDEKVAFFVDTLPQGERRITYRLRAEIPGRFHALPTNVYAMYTPDIRALSDELRIVVTDAPILTAAKPGKHNHR